MSSEVLSCLVNLFNPDEKEVYVKDLTIQKGDNIFICAMNPSNNEEGRPNLPACLLPFLTVVDIPPLTEEELVDIVRRRYCREESLFSHSFDKVIKVHQGLLAFGSNIRHLQNIKEMLNKMKVEPGCPEDIRNYLAAVAVVLGYGSVIINEKQEADAFNEFLSRKKKEEIEKSIGFSII